MKKIKFRLKFVYIKIQFLIILLDYIYSPFYFLNKAQQYKRSKIGKMRQVNLKHSEERSIASYEANRAIAPGRAPTQIKLKSETTRQPQARQAESLPQSQIQTQQAKSSGTSMLMAPAHRQMKSGKQCLTNPRSKDNLQQDYLVICRILEAKLSKDLSTFFSSMNVYCEVEFQNTQINWSDSFLNGENQTNSVSKSTAAETGQNPKWDQEFSFQYQKLTKTGIKHLKSVQQENSKLRNNMQQLDFTLYKKAMLFAGEKIGETTVQLHNASSGSQTDWLILTNDKEEIVGKLLTYIEIKKDNTTMQIRQIQKDLQLQDQMDSSGSAALPGMTRDMTEDKGMPLRNHEQVLLLNERSEPITHITHQTQNSAMGLGGLGNLGKSPKLSASISGQQNRATSNSIMGATNITHVSNPAVGACGQLATLYLETTNIIPQSKIGAKAGMRDEYEDYDSQEDSDEDEGEEDTEVQSGEEEQVHQRAQRKKITTQHQNVHPRAKGIPQQDNIDAQIEDGSMLMAGMGILGMGVVATQHIREEYDEDEEYEDEDDEDEDEEGYGGLQIGMIDETPPVNEGGGPSTSTGVLNTHGNQYGGSGQNTGGRQTLGAISQQPMAVGEVVLSGPGVENQLLEDEDDESNINSDEQNEYLENNTQTSQHMQQNQQIMRHESIQDGHRNEQRSQHTSQQRYQSGRPYAGRPNTATNHASYSQQKQMRLLQQSQSAMNIRQPPPQQQVHPQQFQYTQYQSQKIDPYQKNARAQQISGGENGMNFAPQSRSLNRGERSGNQFQNPPQRTAQQQNNRHFQSNKNPHGAIPKGPTQNNRQTKKNQLFVEGQPIGNQQININTIDVEPSFRSRQNMFHQQSQDNIHSGNMSNSNMNGPSRLVQQQKGLGHQSQTVLRQNGTTGRGGGQSYQQKSRGTKDLNSGYQQSKRTAGFNSSYLNHQGEHNIHHSYNQQQQMNYTPQNYTQLDHSQSRQFFNTNIPNTQLHTQMMDEDENEREGPGARSQQRVRGARVPLQKQHHSNINEFNIGQIDDADLLQNQSLQNGSQLPSEEYQINSEGDEEHYPRGRQQQFGGPIIHSPVPKGNQRRATEAELGSPRAGFAQDQKKSFSLSQSRSKKKKRRQPSQEPRIVSDGQVYHQNYIQNNEVGGVSGVSGQLGNNPLEHETFSMQQQDTFQQKQEAQQLQAQYHPPGFAPGGQMQQFEGNPAYNYISSPIQGPETAKQMKSMGKHPRSAPGYLMRPSTQQTMANQNGLMIPNDFGDSEEQSKTTLAIQYKQNAKNVNRGKANGAGGYHANSSMAQVNEHSVIQHITSHSSHNSEEAVSGNIGPAFGQAPRRGGKANGRNRQVHHSGLPLKTSHYPYSNKAGGPIAVGGGSTEYLYENEQQQQQASLMQQYNSFQEVYEDYMPQNVQQMGANHHEVDMNQYVKNSNKKVRHAQPQYSDADSSKKSDPMSQIAIMNNRALSHEMQLNQMHQNIISQVEKIRKEKAQIKNEKARIKEENMNLIQRKQAFEMKQQQQQKQLLNLRREKLLVNNEMNKVRNVYQQFVDMLQRQYPQQNTIQINGQLDSIKMILDLLMNDREMQRQDSQFELEAETADFDSATRNSGRKELEVQGSQPDQIAQYQQKLESLCSLYQSKIEELGQRRDHGADKNVSKDEMSLAWQNMQDLQVMTDQMRSQMEHINQVQTSMASHMHHVQELVARTPVTNGAQSPMLVGQHYPDRIHSTNVDVNSHLRPRGIDASRGLSQAAMPLTSGQQTPSREDLSNHLQRQGYSNNLGPSLSTADILRHQIEASASDDNAQNYGRMQQEDYGMSEHDQTYTLPAPAQLNPTGSLSLPVRPLMSQETNTHQSKSKGGRSIQASSQLSEFVINPDPNFLAQINANIRSNNVDVDDEDDVIDDSYGAQGNGGGNGNNQWGEKESEQTSEYFSENNQRIEEQKQMLMEQAMAAAEAAAERQRQQQRAAQAAAVQPEESNQLISDCGSNIEIEEDERDTKPNASVSVSVAQIGEHAEAMQSSNSERVLRHYNEGLEEHKVGAVTKPVVQGAQGDDYKQIHSTSIQSSSASQMSVFQSIQQKLQKIGQHQNPPYKNERQKEQPRHNEEEIDSPNLIVNKDIQESDRESNRHSQHLSHHDRRETTEPEIAKEKQDGEWPQEQPDEPDPFEEYYKERVEHSVIYKDEKVYDQPQRAMYGIKKANRNF